MQTPTDPSALVLETPTMEFTLTRSLSEDVDVPAPAGKGWVWVDWMSDDDGLVFLWQRPQRPQRPQPERPSADDAIRWARRAREAAADERRWRALVAAMRSELDHVRQTLAQRDAGATREDA